MEQSEKDCRPVIVLGAKPNLNLPDVEPQAVITTKGAVELGLLYRKRFGSPIIALTPGGPELYDRDYMLDLLKKVQPEEIVVLGVEDGFMPEQFIREKLLLSEVKITIYSSFQRNFSLLTSLGWRRWLLMIHMLSIRGMTHLVFIALPDLFKGCSLNWLSRSTGINGMLYAQKRFPNASQIIVAGVGLEAGGHFNGRGLFTEKSAKSDKIVMRYWVKNNRTQFVTTDKRLSKIGNVTAWPKQSYLENNLGQ